MTPLERAALAADQEAGALLAEAEHALTLEDQPGRLLTWPPAPWRPTAACGGASLRPPANENAIKLLAARVGQIPEPIIADGRIINGSAYFVRVDAITEIQAQPVSCGPVRSGFRAYVDPGCFPALIYHALPKS
jgi:hypothetical protein